MEREMFSHTDVAMTMGLADLLLRCCLSIDSCSVQESFAITTQSLDSYGHIGSTKKLTYKIEPTLQSVFPGLLQGFEDDVLGNSPGWLADTAASYCPGRPSQLTQDNVTKHCDRVEKTLCLVKLVIWLTEESTDWIWINWPMCRWWRGYTNWTRRTRTPSSSSSPTPTSGTSRAATRSSSRTSRGWSSPSRWWPSSTSGTRSTWATCHGECTDFVASWKNWYRIRWHLLLVLYECTMTVFGLMKISLLMRQSIYSICNWHKSLMVLQCICWIELLPFIL